MELFHDMEKNDNFPKDEVTLRSLLVSIIQKTIPNLSTLREKEWAMSQLEKFQINKLEGQKRLIKNTGIVRKVDDLGRFVLPMELRRVLGVGIHSEMEISLDDVNGWVVIEPYNKECHFCGDAKDVNEYLGKRVCDRCVSNMVEMF
jgi:transcriptional pleiotropic regulator of transition state genes